MRLSTSTTLAVILAAVTAPLALAQEAGASTTPTTVRVSVSSHGAQANGRSVVDAVSPNGRFVLFDSWASNLVRSDTNGVRDVFLRDLKSGRTTRVGVGYHERQANGPSRGAAISGDGRFVLFTSQATNLTNQADRNGNVDVFVRNLLRKKTFRVSVRPDGGQFYDRPPYGRLVGGGISDNGRWVAFGEYVSPWPENGDGYRTFVRDRTRHATHRVARYRYSFGDVPVALSPDGRWLTAKAFDDKGNITDYVVRDRWTGRVRTIKSDVLHLYGGAAISPDARYLVTVWPNENVDGTDLVHWDRVANRTLLLLGNHRNWTYAPAGVSADGRYVAFVTRQPGLVSGDTNAAPDLFRLDVTTTNIMRVDVSRTGAQLLKVRVPKWGDISTMLSSDGRWAVFTTADGTAVPNDTNRTADVFLRGPLP
jgi:Tol biopolymer transport system component